jgi:antitoxin HicB
MRYHFKIHKQGKGFWAECLELEGCQTQADNFYQLKLNMSEALNVFLSEPSDSKHVFPLPKKMASRKGIEAIEVDHRVAFSMLLRQVRITRGYTQQQTAEALSMKSLFSYQRLESYKSNPSLETIGKIKHAFPEFHIESVLED